LPAAQGDLVLIAQVAVLRICGLSGERAFSECGGPLGAFRLVSKEPELDAALPKNYTTSEQSFRPPRISIRLHRTYNFPGGENGPVTVPAFKAGDSALRESNGGFDSHTLPPIP